MSDHKAADRPTRPGIRGVPYEASAAAERRRFLENAAAVTVSADREQRRDAARALRALGYRGEPAAKPCGRHGSVALLSKVLGEGVLLRARGRSR